MDSKTLSTYAAAIYQKNAAEYAERHALRAYHSTGTEHALCAYVKAREKRALAEQEVTRLDKEWRAAAYGKR